MNSFKSVCRAAELLVRRAGFVAGGLAAAFLLAVVIGVSTLVAGFGAKAGRELFNVSYDPTRELYGDLNAAFTAQWEEQTGEKLTIRQSHGGSSSQARAVIDGMPADVVTLAMWSDVAAIERKRRIDKGWEQRLPHDSLPYYSTIVFVVRKGNPKNIRDWPDLVRREVKVITPNPKTSGNGKLSLLAAYGAVLHRGGSDDEAREYVRRLYENVPVLDTGARGSTTTFSQKKIGDVHLTWENEAHLEIEEAKGELEIVFPSASIRAEPFVAWVDANIDRRGTRALAEAYLRNLYTPESQEIIARHHYRPSDPDVLARHRGVLRDILLFPVTLVARSWDDAQHQFFSDGGLFDQIYAR